MQRAVQRAAQRWRRVGAEGGADLVTAGVLQVPEEVRTARAEEEARLADLVRALVRVRVRVRVRARARVRVRVRVRVRARATARTRVP